MHALLLAAANTELDGNGRTALQHGAAKAQGHTATASRNWQHAAPPHQPAAASPAAPPDASEPAESSPAPLPVEIIESASRGELQKVARDTRLATPAPRTASSNSPTVHGPQAVYVLCSRTWYVR